MGIRDSSRRSNGLVRFGDATLRTKLLTIAVVPLAGLLWLAAAATIERDRVARETATLGTLVELSVRIGSLLHETQRERGSTAVYVSSRGSKMRIELEAQRAQTDVRVAELSTFLDEHARDLPPRVGDDLADAQGQMAGLATTRASASELRGETKEFVAYYTAVNTRLLRVLGAIVPLTSDARFTRLTTAYVAFLRAKEDTGIERAQLANAFVNRAFAPGQLVTVASLLAEQKDLLRTFSELGPDALVDAHHALGQGETFERVGRLEDAALAGDLSTDPALWFQTVTAKIDAMKGLEDRQSALLLDEIGAARSAARRAVATSVSFGAGLTLVVLLLSLAVIRAVTGPVAEAVRVLAALAEGDLTQRLDVASADEMGRIARALNQAIGGVRAVLEDVQQSAGAVSAAAEQLRSAADGISSGAQEQAGGLEETAASLEELTATVKQTAGLAQRAKELALATRSSADNGERAAARTADAMGEIADASRRVSEISATIDEVAFQINVLSLNATIEAARAGEQGRGFAVVAAEVRALAGRTAAASKEIRTIIVDSNRRVDDGRALALRSGQNLGEILVSVQKLTEIVAHIATASSEQAQGIEQIAQTVGQMDHVTQGNAAQTEEMHGTAESLSDEASRLEQLLERFQTRRDGHSIRPIDGVAIPAGIRARKPVALVHRSTVSR